MVKLYLVESQEQQEIARKIVERHHSYVPSFNSVGRKIDYLITLDERIVGMIGIGSATYPPCKDVLSYLNISKQQYAQIFNSFANNWRFCLTESHRNLGTQALKQLRSLAPYHWKQTYGDTLTHILTFVGADHNGAVYRADNWELIGSTAGLPSHQALSMKWDIQDLHSKFVKPTGENKKLIFIHPVRLVAPNEDTLF